MALLILICILCGNNCGSWKLDRAADNSHASQNTRHFLRSRVLQVENDGRRRSVNIQPIGPIQTEKSFPSALGYWEYKPRLRSLICICTMSFLSGTRGAYWLRFVTFDLCHRYEKALKREKDSPTFLARHNRQTRRCALGGLWGSC